MNIKDLIVYEDKYLVIINKPRGLLSQFDGNKDNPSLDVMLSEYLGKQAMLINRLDKDVPELSKDKEGLQNYVLNKVVKIKLKIGFNSR